MLRTIGLVTSLALVACGGGGGTSGGATSGTSSPPPPPPINGYTVGGTVSGLVGSGLALAICRITGGSGGRGGPGVSIGCDSPLQVSTNGAFTLASSYPAGYSGHDYVHITQQPSSPPQNCVISKERVSIQSANDTSVTVTCAEYSYVTNAADDTLSSYIVDATTGALAVIGTPIATGVSPHAIAGRLGSEAKKIVIVANEGSNDISAFAVNPVTGALTAVPGSPFAAGTDPQAMAFYGGYLFVTNAGSDDVSAYTIDTDTGAVAVPSTTATGKGPTSIAVISNQFDYQFVFVANHGGSNDISVFSFDVATGVLTPIAGSPFPAGGNPLNLAVGAGGKFLYTSNPDATNPSISGFSIDPVSGALSPLTGSPFPLPVSHYMATDPTGTYLYVTSGANVIGYSIDATTGALTVLAGFPVSAGANAYSISFDPTQQFLYVVNDGAANISGFRFEASTGALTPMSASPFSAGNHPDFLLATFF
jgi:6-phosphogluconolactonase